MEPTSASTPLLAACSLASEASSSVLESGCSSACCLNAGCCSGHLDSFPSLGLAAAVGGGALA